MTGYNLCLYTGRGAANTYAHKTPAAVAATPHPDWAGLFLLTFILGHLYVLLEWVFTVTRPSYLDVFPWLDKLKVLLFSGALAAGLSLLGLGALVLVGRLVGLRRLPRLYFWLASLLPAGLLAALLLLLVDNFTYTLFSFGIATTSGAWRGLYAALFVGTAGLERLGCAGGGERGWTGGWAPRSRGRGCGSGWGYGWCCGWHSRSPSTGGEGTALDTAEAELSRRPHILWITVRRAERRPTCRCTAMCATPPPTCAPWRRARWWRTMPFPMRIRPPGRWCRCSPGKHPLRTRVMYLPDILVGAESYQHLPGILRAQGYYAVQYGFPYYVDAYSLNMLDSFDVANGRALSHQPAAGRAAEIPARRVGLLCLRDRQPASSTGCGTSSSSRRWRIPGIRW